MKSGLAVELWWVLSHTHTELWWERYQRELCLQGTAASSPKLIYRIKEKEKYMREKSNTLDLGCSKQRLGEILRECGRFGINTSMAG